MPRTFFLTYLFTHLHLPTGGTTHTFVHDADLEEGEGRDRVGALMSAALEPPGEGRGLAVEVGGVEGGDAADEPEERAQGSPPPFIKRRLSMASGMTAEAP